MADLKPVYRASTKESAELALDELEAKWGIHIHWSSITGVINGITYRLTLSIQSIFARLFIQRMPLRQYIVSL